MGNPSEWRGNAASRSRSSGPTRRPRASRVSRISSRTMPRSISIASKIGARHTSERNRNRQDSVVRVRRSRERAAESLERQRLLVRGRMRRRDPMQHVLEEVADAVVARAFVAGADAHVQGDGRAPRVRQRDEDDAQPVRQPMALGLGLGRRLTAVHCGRCSNRLRRDSHNWGSRTSRRMQAMDPRAGSNMLRTTASSLRRKASSSA